MHKKMVVLAVLLVLVLAVPATADQIWSLGVSGIYGYSRESFEFAIKPWGEVLVLLDDQPLCFLETEIPVTRQGLWDPRISYRLNFASINVTGAHPGIGGVSYFLPKSMDSNAIAMERVGGWINVSAKHAEGTAKFRVPVNMWTTEIMSRDLVVSANPVQFILWGRIDKKMPTGVIGWIERAASGTSRFGSTKAFLTLDLSQPATPLTGNAQEVFAGYFERKGWIGCTRQSALRPPPEPSEEPVVETGITDPQSMPSVTIGGLEDLGISMDRVAEAIEANSQVTQEMFQEIMAKLAQEADQPQDTTATWAQEAQVTTQIQVVEPVVSAPQPPIPIRFAVKIGSREWAATGKVKVTVPRYNGGLVAHYPVCNGLTWQMNGPRTYGKTETETGGTSWNWTFSQVVPGLYTFTVHTTSGQTGQINVEVK